MLTRVVVRCMLPGTINHQSRDVFVRIGNLHRTMLAAKLQETMPIKSFAADQHHCQSLVPNGKHNQIAEGRDD